MSICPICTNKFECKSGYHQIKLAEVDIHKTTFSSPGGLYEWLVLPFGRKNAPSQFRCRMDTIFKPYIPFIVNYIDDFVVFSYTMQEHLQHIQKFTEIIQKHGIRLSTSHDKFQLTQQSIDLGVTISKVKISMQAHPLTKLT